VALGQAYPLAPRFRWECLSIPTMARFPGPAHPNRTCGFPASGSRTGFTSRHAGRYPPTARNSYSTAKMPGPSLKDLVPSTLSLDVELPLKPLESTEFLGLTANLLSSAPSEAHPHRGPFPPPALPGFLSNMDPSDTHLGPPFARAVEGQRLPHLDGSPVLRRALSLRAVPTTPASHPEPRRLSSLRTRRPSPR